ncbi:hypothetical protein [Cytobacillus firmus]|uniref:hypothetical protein n=1 Tax=Cytobacillus firmus TaxID=1399 RepID=UPI003001B961
MKNEAQQNKKHADIKEKRKRLDQPRHALEGKKSKSFFDFSIWTEVTRGARPLQLDKGRKKNALI